MYFYTLVSLIIVHDGINVQAGKYLKNNKCAGWNKAVQDGIFQKINKICCMIIRETRVCSFCEVTRKKLINCKE